MSPTKSTASEVNSPGFNASIHTVTSAQTHTPGTKPVSATTPVGISTLIVKVSN